MEPIVLKEQRLTLSFPVEKVYEEPLFQDFGMLFFPVNLTVDPRLTFAEVSSSYVYPWYSNIHPNRTVSLLHPL